MPIEAVVLSLDDGQGLQHGQPTLPISWKSSTTSPVLSSIVPGE